MLVPGHRLDKSVDIFIIWGLLSYLKAIAASKQNIPNYETIMAKAT